MLGKCTTPKMSWLRVCPQLSGHWVDMANASDGLLIIKDGPSSFRIVSHIHRPTWPVCAILSPSWATGSRRPLATNVLPPTYQLLLILVHAHWPIAGLKHLMGSLIRTTIPPLMGQNPCRGNRPLSVP